MIQTRSVLLTVIAGVLAISGVPAAILLVGQTERKDFVISGSSDLPVTGSPVRVPSTIDGPSITVPPLAKFQRILPLVASSAYICPELEPAYMTPFATLTEPLSMLPAMGSADCQRIFPVATSNALHAPQVIFCPEGTKVYGRWSLFAIAT